MGINAATVLTGVEWVLGPRVEETEETEDTVFTRRHEDTEARFDGVATPSQGNPMLNAHDILERLPAREGHFLLESGYHTNLWLTLDALFVNPREIAPLVTALAARLRTHDVTAVCGPLQGGAFLAQALATALDVEFFFTEAAGANAAGLFAARYRLPPGLERRISGQRVAIVDDAISAGSSVRATADAVTAGGGSVAVIGALFALGTVGLEHSSAAGIPVESLRQHPFAMWSPSACPLCAAAMPLEDPLATGRSRNVPATILPTKDSIRQ